MNSSLYSRTKHTRYWLMMGAICLLVVVRNILKIQIPLASFLVAGFALCATSNREEIIAFICSMAPFEMTFQYRYMLLIGAMFLVIKGRRYNIRNIFPVLFMVIWDALHYMNHGIDISEFIRTFAVLITLGLILVVEPVDYSDGLPMRSLALMTLFSSLVTVYVNRGLTGYSFTSGDRLGSTYDQAESFNALLNPNVGAFLCVLSICGLLLLQRNKNKKRMDLPVMLALSLIILLFQSRSAMISLAFAIVVCLYANNRNWVLLTLRTLGIVLVLAIIGFLFFRNTITGFLMRFMTGDFSTGRVAIFGFYNQFLMSDWKNLFFGVGLYGYSARIAQQFARNILSTSGAVTYVNDHMTLIMSHNNIQEIILVWGIPGVILMIWLLSVIVKHKTVPRNILHYLVFDFILLYTLQGQLLSSNIVMIGLIFSMVCMEYKNAGIMGKELFLDLQIIDPRCLGGKLATDKHSEKFDI